MKHFEITIGSILFGMICGVLAVLILKWRIFYQD